MAFELPDLWTWDFWIADDGEVFHLFHLQAPRSLGDPELRHRNATVGHAVSGDLRTWRRVGDALQTGRPGAFDDLATWTGSVVRDDDGGWRLFYTGLSRGDEGNVQRLGVATSEGLHAWRRPDPQWVLEADDRWYERRSESVFEDTWRDPWVMRADDGWHMYITARSSYGAEDGLVSGVVGHATSADLETWVVHPPVGNARGRFAWLEVCQVVEVDGTWVLLFSCLADKMSEGDAGRGGVWSVAMDGPWGPVDLEAARPLTDDTRYAGRLVQDRAGTWQVLAFVMADEHGDFRGGLAEPVPVRWDADRRALTT